MKFVETSDAKMYRSEEFNYNFSKQTGYTELWGKTQKDDPKYFPFPLICDMEITTICNGVDGTPCKFCYKSNTSKGINMSFVTAKNIIDKLPKQLTQIAFGVDATLNSNPDWYKIFNYTIAKGIIPNVTVANIDKRTAYLLYSVCGAVAVSRYENKEYCYNSVKNLTDCKMKQVNIHQLLSKETLNQVFETIKDINTDDRLSDLNAIVFLSLKKKGRGTKYTSLSKEEFKSVIKACTAAKINYGFDSCSYHKWAKCIEDKNLLQYGEPCESTLHSAYINAEGCFFPCSFTEGMVGWKKGLSVTTCNDFIKDIWNHPKTKLFRNSLLSNNRKCPMYTI